MGRTAPATHEFCSLCNCRVPLQNGGWRTHEQGIRHRRNVASQKLTGQPGAAVVSTFEDLSWIQSCSSAQTNDPLVSQITSKQPQQQQQARHNRTSQLPQQQQRPPAAAGGPAPADVNAALSSVQLQLRKHVATHAGVGPTYQLSLSRFETQALRSWLGTLQQGCQQALAQGAPAAGGAVLMEALPGGAAPHLRLMASRQSGAALLAAAAVLLRVQPGLCSELSVCVPYQTHGPEAIAATAALSALITSLAHQPRLVKLRVLVDPSEYRSVLLQGGTGTRQLTALWGGVLGALRGLLGVRMLLEELQLCAPPGVFDPHDLAELNTTLLLAPRVVRAAVLLGLHPRIGAASLLRRLPGEVVGEVLERGAPKRGCVLVLKTPSLLADSSSSDEDEGDTSSSDASDGSDSDGEGGSSEEGGVTREDGSSGSSGGEETESGSSTSSSSGSSRGGQGRHRHQRSSMQYNHHQQQQQQQRRQQTGDIAAAAAGAAAAGAVSPAGLPSSSRTGRQQAPSAPGGRAGASGHFQSGSSGSGSNRRVGNSHARQLQQLDLTAAAAGGEQRRRASQGGGCSSGGDSPQGNREQQQRHVAVVVGGGEAAAGDSDMRGACWSSGSSEGMS